jgi:RNA polymerase sigma-70 factor (ECF subfamily)
MIDAENQVGIEKMLGILSEPVKVVFLLHREDGFSYKEIAELLQISVKTVEAHMGKALKLLRENLKNTSFDMLIKS